MITSSPHFSPSTSALVCNILWFTSLSLSLSCALLATLLGQWVQHFLHHAEMRPAPVIGARIMSYFYYGIRRFDMHAVVIAVPLLFHASLFFFFAGLIAFLIPVNLVVMGVCSTVPFIFLVIYCVITLLPLRYLDCPYRTPLSGALWHTIRRFRRIIGSRNCSADTRPPMHDTTMVAAMTREATADSDERARRDSRALSWTVKSLVDDEQLEQFVDSIPGLLQHDERVTTTDRYEEHIKTLIEDPHIQLHVRI
jgi:hypothetical protein